MPSRSVIITYTTHPPASPLLSSAIKGIRSQLPLRNLHWKPSTRTSLRTIQELDVRFVELGEAGSLGKEPGGSVLESPLVNLCLVTCENDETYKTQTRSFIRDWLSLLAARKGSYVPLIVLVNPSTAAGSGKNVFGRDKGVFGKLKADFNLNKKERCVQLNLPPEGTSDPAAWPDVMNKLKESIVSAFDNVIVDREEDVKRGEAQRLTVGWNFCTWFLLKESLAYSFEGVNLYEDALIVYEELEASFFQVLKEQNLSWFGKLGANGARDDSLPILDTGAKPYRELLQTSSLSIFDFRIYVFARQAQLLGKIGRITEIAKRGQWFVASLARRLRENEADLAEHFIESWIYSTCMNVVQNCDEWSRIDRPNGDYSGLIAYESARSELLDIARVQTERIGVASGHLPNTYPFASSSGLTTASDNVLFESSETGSTDDDTADTPSRPTLSNQQLLDAMADTKTYREMYAHLTRKAISAYEACAKHNSVIRLKADLAALALIEEDWKMGYELCRRLARDCADLEVWEPVAEYALSGALKSHRKLGMERGEDWINLALAFLRVCALIESGTDLENRQQELQSVSEELEASKTESTSPSHPAFDLRILNDAAVLSDDADVPKFQVEVKNNLSLSVTLSSLEVHVEDSSGERIVFTAAHVHLPAGPNAVELSCYTSVQGIFNVTRASLHLGPVDLIYLLDTPPSPIRIQRHRSGPSFNLSLPLDIALDKDQRIIVELKSGKWAMKDAKLSLQSYEASPSLLLAKAECSTRSIDYSNESIILGNLNASESLSIAIPYTMDGQDDRIRARLRVSYTSTEGRAREYIDTQSISTALPLTVNVQDFFRPDFLISHFTIASDGRKHLRIESVDLAGGQPQGYDVTGASKADSAPSVVSPLQPLSCLFKVTRSASDSRSGDPAVLRLVIRYTCLDEEFNSLLTAVLSSGDFPTAVTRQIHRMLDDPSVWLQDYLVSNNVAKLCENALQAAATESAASQADIDRFLSVVRGAQEANEHQWRRLEIPVEMPRQRLLTVAHFEYSSAGESIYEGRALSMSLCLKSSFDWLDDKSRDLKLVFDVQVNGDDWIVLGKKKGYYVPSPETPEAQEIVLVPVRPGQLYLPHVQVLQAQTTPTDGDGPLVCETYVDNAAEAIEVLPAKGTAMTLIAM